MVAVIIMEIRFSGAKVISTDIWKAVQSHTRMWFIDNAKYDYYLRILSGARSKNFKYTNTRLHTRAAHTHARTHAREHAGTYVLKQIVGKQYNYRNLVLEATFPNLSFVTQYTYNKYYILR